MDFLEMLEYYWRWFQMAFEYPLWLLDTIALLLYIFARFSPISKRGIPKVKRFFVLARRYSVYALLVIILFGIVQAPYRMYADNQIGV